MILPRDLPRFAVFAAIARNGSFTAAARELGMTKSMVSAHLRSLETKFGVRLVERTSRSVRLTAAGEATFLAAQRMLDEARAIEGALTTGRLEPAGRLRVGVPHGLAATVVAPVAASLVRAHPRLAIDVVADDAVQDLVRDDLDLAVRIGALRDSTYVMRRLGSSSVILVAAPALGLGAAARPSELGEVPWVRHTLVERGDHLTLVGPRERKETVQLRIRASANTMDVFRTLLVSGAGAGMIPELHVQDELAKGTLVRVCPGWIRRTVTVYGLFASREVPAHAEVFLTALRSALVLRASSR